MCMLEKRLKYSGIIAIDLYNVRYGGYCLAGTLRFRNAKCLCISRLYISMCKMLCFGVECFIIIGDWKMKY